MHFVSSSETFACLFFSKFRTALKFGPFYTCGFLFSFLSKHLFYEHCSVVQIKIRKLKDLSAPLCQSVESYDKSNLVSGRVLILVSVCYIPRNVL